MSVQLNNVLPGKGGGIGKVQGEAFINLPPLSITKACVMRVPWAQLEASYRAGDGQRRCTRNTYDANAALPGWRGDGGNGLTHRTAGYWALRA